MSQSAMTPEDIAWLEARLGEAAVGATPQHAVGIEDERGRHGGDVQCVLDRRRAGILQVGVVEPELVDERRRLGTRASGMDADHVDIRVPRRSAQHRRFRTARHAPGRPHIEQPNLAFEVIGRNGLVASLQLRQLECRHLRTDQWRRDLAWIKPQTGGKKTNQNQKSCQGQQVATHRYTPKIRMAKKQNRLNAGLLWFSIWCRLSESN